MSMHMQEPQQALHSSLPFSVLLVWETSSADRSPTIFYPLQDSEEPILHTESNRMYVLVLS